MYILILSMAARPTPTVYRFRKLVNAQSSVITTVNEGNQSSEPVPRFEPVDGLKDSYTFDYRGFRAWIYNERDVPIQEQDTMLVPIEEPDTGDIQ